MKKSGPYFLWTEKEKKYLYENKDKTALEISKEINRTKDAILRKCSELGIKLNYVHNGGKASSPEKEKERKRKISESMKKNPKAGGLRKGSGRGKKGWYKGYWCDSSWELAWVIYQLEQNNKFERNLKKFRYSFNGETHYYIPDFIMNGVYYEIKGYMTEKNKEKIKQFSNNLIVVDKIKIEPIIKCVVEKYGKNYIKMYDNYKPTRLCSKCENEIYKHNKCGVCIECIRKEYKKRTPKKKKVKIKDNMCKCGKKINRRSIRCVDCHNESQKKVKNRPDKETLIEEIKKHGYSGTGRKYGVSDNTIRKWL